MITTRFLLQSEYQEYGKWLKKQDAETLNMYFGIPVSYDTINQLVAKICNEKSQHEFLVAEEKGKWVGCVHIAIGGNNNKEVEFGIIIKKKMRGKKIGSKLLNEAITWARNRRYHDLYMHCLSWNQPIKHLCTKHGLQMSSMYGETEVKVILPPPTFTSLIRETTNKQSQLWHVMLENLNPYYHAP